VRYFHRTSHEAAALIDAGGFADAEGRFGTSQSWRGVWISDEVLDEHEGIDPSRMASRLRDRRARGRDRPWEWAEAGKRARVPTDV
jgi:hypothetical protein